MSSSSFAQSDRDRVLDATDLVALVGEHVALKPKGREHVGLCPFHDDRSPSLAIVTHKGNGFYKCFACGAAGNAIDFVMNFHRMPFPDALRFLAGRAGIELRDRFERSEPPDGIGKDDLFAANRLAQRFFTRMLADEAVGGPGRAAVAGRRIAPAMAEAFGIGYAPDRRDGIRGMLERVSNHASTAGREPPPRFEAFVEAGLVRDGRAGLMDLLRHRLTFPICDELGRPIAFGGRKIREEDEPKYLNSPESPIFHKGRTLYGIHLAKQAIVKSKVAVVTEGYTDVIACHEAGFTNVVATLGTALTREHAKMLRRLCESVILLFDGDAAGIRAAERGVEVFFGETIDVKVCTLPDGLDPDELLRAPDGRERFAAALDGAIDALAFLVRRFRADYAAKTGLSGRQQALEALLRRLADLGFGELAGVRRRFVLASLASLTGLSESELEAALPAQRARVSERGRSAADDADGPAPSAATPTIPIARARREAERTFLALLLANEDLASATVRCGVGADSDAEAEPVPGPRPNRTDGAESPAETVHLPITEAWTAERLLDPEHAALYRTWQSLADAGHVPSFPRVLAELADDSGKRLASDLYLLGEARRGGDARETLDLLQSAFDDLERLDRRERSRTSRELLPEAAPLALDVTSAAERLRRLRVRGPDVTAIPRPANTRSAPSPPTPRPPAPAT